MSLDVDWSFWLTIVGTVATIVFGIWAILLAKRWDYPGQITYFRERPIRLLDDITGNLPKLAITYENAPVKKNLMLLKGFLVNTGRKDITKEMMERPLCFELGNGYRWLAASAKASSNGEEHATITNEKTVTFSFGLFRCYEFLKFEGLIEVADGATWRGRIYTDHRIADTSEVRIKDLPAKPEKLSWLVSKGLGAILFSLLMFTGSVNYYKPPNRIHITAWLVVSILACVIATWAVWDNRSSRKIRRILRIDSD